MSVQRYNTMSKRSEGGLFVLYADHVAAVAEAEQRGREEAYNEIPAIAVYGERLRSEGYDVGYTDALDAAMAALAALLGKTVPPSDGVTEALAAIDALKGGQA